MAPETYYFMFSFSAVLLGALQITNMAYFRKNSETIFGSRVYQKGSIEHTRLSKFSSGRSVTMTILLELAFVANLTYDIRRLLNLPDQSYARTTLIYFPIAIVIFFVLVLFAIRKQIKNYH